MKGDGHAESPLTESDIIALFPKRITLYLPDDVLYTFPQVLGLKLCLFGVGWVAVFLSGHGMVVMWSLNWWICLNCYFYLINSSIWPYSTVILHRVSNAQNNLPVDIIWIPPLSFSYFKIWLYKSCVNPFKAAVLLAYNWMRQGFIGALAVFCSWTHQLYAVYSYLWSLHWSYALLFNTTSSNYLFTKYKFAHQLLLCLCKVKTSARILGWRDNCYTRKQDKNTN